MAIITNLTPHSINLLNEDNEVVRTIESSGVIPRLSMDVVHDGFIDGIAINKTVMGELTGLPEQKEDTYLIVGALIKSACPTREDLLVPSEQVRNEKGQVIGCRALSR